MLAEIDVEAPSVEVEVGSPEAGSADAVEAPVEASGTGAESAPPTAPAPQAQEEPTDPPPPPPARTSAVVHRQSQEQLARLDEMKLALEGLANADDAFRTLMADHGLTVARLAAALVLNQSAYAAVAARRQADALASAAAADQRNAYRQCRAAIVAFRQVIRTVVHDDAGRIALGVDEPLPLALAGYATVAAETLEAAQTEPYATLLATVGYDAERVARLQALLDAFTLLATRHRAAQKAAERATAARDGVVLEVRAVLRQIKAEVYALLRRYPFLSTPTGF